MLNDSLYQTLKILPPFKGQNEDAEYIASQDQQGFCQYLQNCTLNGQKVKLRHGVKQVLPFLRWQDDRNKWPYDPLSFQIKKIMFFGHYHYAALIEHIYEFPMSMKFKFKKHTILFQCKLKPQHYYLCKLIQNGGLQLNFEGVDSKGKRHEALIRCENYSSQIKYEGKTPLAIRVRLPKFRNPADKSTFVTPDNLKSIKLIAHELLLFERDQLMQTPDGNHAHIKHLGIRGVPSYTMDKNYFVFSTGCDPVIIWNINTNQWDNCRYTKYLQRRSSNILQPEENDDTGHLINDADQEEDEDEELEIRDKDDPPWPTKKKKDQEIEMLGPADITIPQEHAPILGALNNYNGYFLGVVIDHQLNNKKANFSAHTFKHSLKIAHTTRLNDPCSWYQSVGPVEIDIPNNQTIHDLNTDDLFDSNDLDLGLLDLTAKHGCHDRIMGMCFFENNICFLGRRKIQVWEGGTFVDDGDPDKVRMQSKAAAQGPVEVQTYKPQIKFTDLKWVKNFEEGVWGHNVWAVTNIGVFFISHGGIRIITYDEQFTKPLLKLLSIDGIDSTIRDFLMSDTSQKPTAFAYNRNGMFGFRVCGVCIVGFVRSKSFLGWATFTGAFVADDYALDYRGNLIVLHDQYGRLPQVRVYDDARAVLPKWYNAQYTGPEHINSGSYADQEFVQKADTGAEAIEDLPISIEFVIPMDLGTKFACKYFMIFADYFTQMNLDENANKVSLIVSSDLPNTTVNQSDVAADPVVQKDNAVFRWMGDKFYSLRIDTSHMQIVNATPLIARSKFVAKRFKIGLQANLKYTEFSFKKLELYGIINNNQ